ncbi:hypothetical protein FWP33_09025 [Vibrio parahaemolyticus]|nr:hypothetical protein [Vibrio parahaemolyticus]
MSITPKSTLEWAGNVGSVDFTPNEGLLRCSVARTRVRPGAPNETTWMPCVFTKNQTATFAKKFRPGDVLELKGDLAIGEYQGKMTYTLFVQQVIRHEPKGVKNMQNLYYQAAKVGNHHLTELMRDTNQFHNLFWNFVQQILPGTPIPDLQQTAQVDPSQKGTVKSQSQPVVNTTPQQPAATQSQPVVNTTPQQPAASQSQPVVNTTPQQPAASQSQPVVNTTPQQPAATQSQPVVNTTPQQPAATQSQPVVNTTPQQPEATQVQSESVAQATPQYQTESQPHHPSTSTNAQAQVGMVDLANLPKHLQEQIAMYAGEGGAATATNPNFIHNPELEVPEAIQANAHDIASEHLANTDNFYAYPTN